MREDQRSQSNSNHSIQLSLNELQYPLHQRQQDALAECDRLINHFQKEAIRHRRGFQRLKALGILFALATTVLAALAAPDRLPQDWIVPATSGVATLFMALLGQTSAQRVWMQSQAVQQKLQVEKFLYLQSASSYAAMLNEEDQIRYFSQRLMDIWAEGLETSDHTLVRSTLGSAIAPIHRNL